MKRFFAAVLFLSSLPAFSQNWTTVSAANITDLNQQKLAAGQLCFLATDQNDNPISISIGGGGQLLRRTFCSSVANGTVTAFSVPNPATTSPAGVYYRVTVNDSSTGKEVLRYPQVTFSGATFNFDAYGPTSSGSFAPLNGTSVNGTLNVNGNLVATGSVTASNIPSSILQQVFSSGVGQTQRTAVNFMAGVVCADNAGTARTDCRLGTQNVLAFSATPTFDASVSNNFKLTLTGNVTLSTLANAVAGEHLTFELCQDAIGGRTFVPPANVLQWSAIPGTANTCSAQLYVFDGTNAIPDLMPGLSGDVTSPPGSTATTVAATHLGAPLPLAQGGTGQATAAAAFNALAPMTTLGDLVFESAASTASRLAGNTTTTKKYLQQVGTGAASAAPSWQQIAAADLSDGNTGTGAVVHAASPALTGVTLTTAGSGNNVNLLNAQDTLAAVTGNGTDQTLYSFTIPANTVGAGKCVELWTLSKSNSPVSVTYKIILGATTLGTIPNSAGVEADQFQVGICNNAGVQNAQANVFFAVGGIAIISNNSTTSAENFANALALKITANEASPNTVTPIKWDLKLLQ